MKVLPNSLIKLDLYARIQYISLSFITKLTNLQELRLSFLERECFINFEELQHAIIPQLQILEIPYACPKFELLIQFLENNGKNLKKLYISDNYGCSYNSLNLAIVSFCPNLRKLSTGFKKNEMGTLKILFNSCEYLESIKIWCGGLYMSEKEALETFVKYSHKNICELKLYYKDQIQSELLPEELESFFISWMNRIPQESLSLGALGVAKYRKYSLDTNDENMKVIEKYIKMGVIKKFNFQ